MDIYAYVKNKLNINDGDLFIKSLNPKIKTYDRNEIIYHDSIGNDKMGFVVSGMLYLCIENELADRSILGFFRSGEYFLNSMKMEYNDSISYFVSKYQSQVMFFDTARIVEMSAHNQAGQKAALRILSEQPIDYLLSQSNLMHQRGIRNKLMYFFRLEAKLQHSNSIEVPIPYSDLCDYLSVERTAMMKEISLLNRDNIIKSDGKSVTLL